MTVESRNAFGEMLRRYRLTGGLTQEELAERAHLSVRSLSDLERGRTGTPRPGTIRLLGEALDLTPSQRAELLDIVQGRGASPAHPALPAPSLTPLVGRQDILSTLARHLTGYGPPLLMLAGEPGIGKTRLLQEAAGRGVEQGSAVLTGGSSRWGGRGPYAPILEALERHIRGQEPASLRAQLEGSSWLVQLLPELAEGVLPHMPASSLSPEQQRRLMFAAVTRFLTNVAGEGGTLLVLDDLQWADTDGLDLLTTALRVASQIPLRVVAAYRDTDVRDDEPLAIWLADLAHAALVQQHRLGPLPSKEAAQLLDALLSREEGMKRGISERVLQRSGGVPFFLVSCAQALHSVSDGDLVEVVPWTLTQSIHQRLAALSELAQDVLRVVALASQEIQARLLVELMQGPEHLTYAAADEATRARLLTAGEDGYQVAHDVIREVIEGDLQVGRRRALHRRIAGTLERMAQANAIEMPVEVLAYHFSRSDDEAKAAHYVEQAGDWVRERKAHAASVAYYRQAIAILERLGRSGDAAGVRFKLGGVLRVMGRYDEALQVLEEAAAAYRAVDDLEALGRVAAEIGYTQGARGTLDEGIIRLEALRGVFIAEQLNGRGLASLYAALAYLYLMSGRHTDHLAIVERTADLARAMGDDESLAAAELSQSVGLILAGRTEEAFAALDRGDQLARAVGNLPALILALTNVSGLCSQVGELERGEFYANRGIEIAEQLSDAAKLATLHQQRARIQFLRGEWDAAQTDAELAVSLVRQAGPSLTATFPFLDIANSLLSRGDVDAARPYLEEGLQLAHEVGDPMGLCYAHGTMAKYKVLAGHPADARDSLLPVCAGPYQYLATTWALIHLAWACLDLGELDEAAHVATRGVATARAEHAFPFLVDALCIQGRIAVQRCQWLEAEQAVEEALTLARSSGYVYGEALSMAVHGELAFKRGEPVRAYRSLIDASAVFRRLGAQADAERAEHMLRALPART